MIDRSQAKTYCTSPYYAIDINYGNWHLFAQILNPYMYGCLWGEDQAIHCNPSVDADSLTGDERGRRKAKKRHQWRHLFWLCNSSHWRSGDDSLEDIFITKKLQYCNRQQRKKKSIVRDHLYIYNWIWELLHLTTKIKLNQEWEMKDQTINIGK